jgi:hypothetical protein
MAQGITVFPNVSAALTAGFAVYDRTEYGYLVRTRLNDRWVLAIALAGVR